uniref:Uncharacterized protein ZK112.5 n=2 Tax=Caenorhabditis elegans TaxID=6239 RepID=YOG5_CAEEL|nr:RecName: Full=Uncharacterized protein ZK112.5 [Caenorhabditis elegans]|eukprot:NP_498685.1 Uncharacterized protein CELE_ZK112.5 [Caenorhabditis elegans]
MNPKIEDSEFNWENEDIVMKLVDEKGKAHPVSKAELLESLESRKLGLETRVLDKYHENHVAFENVLVLDAPQDLETIVNLLLPWYMGKTLTLFEGPLNYPDSSRLAQIISKHNVDIVLGSDYNYSIPNPEYLKLFPVPSLKLVDLPNFESISNYLTISR